MDPRPYNYQYRRPRLDNQTYQSFNAYQSLVHAGKLQSQYHNPQMRDEHAYFMNLYNPNYPNIYGNARNNQNMNINEEPTVKRYQDKSINTDRYSEKSHKAKSTYSEKSQSSNSSKQNYQNNHSSILSNYGSNSLQKNVQNLGGQLLLRNDTSTIYKKQQRPFDIINFRARQSSPLKKFPKLTLEHLLQERGVINMD